MTLKDRTLLLVAAALTASSLLLPLWGFRMSAPQYPDEALHIQVTRAGLTGDLQEVETLQHYIGVAFPTDLAELEWVTPAILAVAVLFGTGAIVGRRGLARVVRTAGVLALAMVLVASLIALQMRLYQVGHERDPNAPITAIKDFTPPAVGPVTVGNFTVWSFPHAGGLALALAGACAGVATARGFRRTGRVAVSRGAAARAGEALPS
jgi:copper chaperone NosL